MTGRVEVSDVHGKQPTGGRRVACVQRDVQQRDFKFAYIDLNWPGVWINCDLKLDVTPQRGS
jgi:hypothetical protein